MLVFIRATDANTLDNGDETFSPIALPVEDIKMIDPHTTRNGLCWIWLKEHEEPYCICDHSMEELAQALGANVAHMEGKFETALVKDVMPPKKPSSVQTDFPSPDPAG